MHCPARVLSTIGSFSHRPFQKFVSIIPVLKRNVNPHPSGLYKRTPLQSYVLTRTHPHIRPTPPPPLLFYPIMCNLETCVLPLSPLLNQDVPLTPLCCTVKAPSLDAEYVDAHMLPSSDLSLTKSLPPGFTKQHYQIVSRILALSFNRRSYFQPTR